MAELSAYMAAATSRPLPEAVAEAARHHLLDTFAAMVSGAGLLPGRQAHRYARAQGAAAAPRPSPPPASPACRPRRRW
jgi:2-methylcitrate dehydratase PrpD